MMELFEYIKSQLPQMPNVAIMKDLGASDELVEYVKKTTWNTNLGMMETLGCDDEPAPSGEVWFTGTVDASQACNGTIRQVSLSPTTIADLKAFNDNIENLNISVNDVDLPYFTNTSDESFASGMWYDSEQEESVTYGFMIEVVMEDDYLMAMAIVPCGLADGTKVEVTVTHK